MGLGVPGTEKNLVPVHCGLMRRVKSLATRWVRMALRCIDGGTDTSRKRQVRDIVDSRRAFLLEERIVQEQIRGVIDMAIPHSRK